MPSLRRIHSMELKEGSIVVLAGSGARPESIQWNWKEGDKETRISQGLAQARIHSMELKGLWDCYVHDPFPVGIHSMELKVIISSSSFFSLFNAGIHSMELKAASGTATLKNPQRIHSMELKGEPNQRDWHSAYHPRESIQWNWKLLCHYLLQV